MPGVRVGRAFAGGPSTSAVVGVAAWLVVSPALAEVQINPNGWKFPNILTAAKQSIRVSDQTPLIPGKETILKGYRRTDGTFFRTYEIEGRIFGVEFDTNGKPPFEYGIMDTDGDGKFETKIIYGPDNKDHGYVPQWVIDHFYKVHPELKNATSHAAVPPPRLNVSVPPPTSTPPPPPKVVVPPPSAVQQPNP